MTDVGAYLSEPTEIEKEMVKRIRTFWNNDNFVNCSRYLVKTDDERREVIGAIKDGIIKTTEDLALYIFQISEDRKKENNHG
ncbi:MAG: hypothetical protein I3I94_04770 [Acidaminococcaceae bacterium]|nr:hypothetical protein [Acidaminococcaceae bacterium]HAY61070.1 hypothetical protein [Acidaminococcaceae bacterium]